MTDIPWDEMPEGATHYDPEDKRAPWLRVMGGWWYFFGDGHWNRDGHINSPSNRRREESCILLVKQPPKPQWRGPEDGWPPVGVECMAQWLIPPDGGAMDPDPVLIKGYFDKQVWFTARSGEDIVMLKNNVLFSPLPIKRNKWMEKALAISGNVGPDAARAIHDALLSGELPPPEQE